MEQIIRKPEFLWFPSLHKAQTEQIYLNMRRALDSACRGNILIKTNDYVGGNGCALSRRGGPLFDGGIASARLEPGDTIVVPEDLERVAWLKEIKDIATILGQIALMAGVVFVALK